MARELTTIIGQTTEDLITHLETLKNSNKNFQFTNQNKPRKRTNNNQNGRKRK